MIPAATLDARIKRDQQKTVETQRLYVQQCKPAEVQAAEAEQCPAAPGFKHWIPKGTTECVRGCGLSFSPELFPPPPPPAPIPIGSYYTNH